MKGIVPAVIFAFVLAGYVYAEDMQGVLVKVEGKSVTFYKVKVFKGTGKGLGKIDKDGDAITATVTASVKVARGSFNYEEKKWVATDPIEGGLDADIFKNINQKKGLTVSVSIAKDGEDKGKITQILVGGSAKKKKGN